MDKLSTTTLSAQLETSNTPKAGYVRCDGTHVGTQWSFEVLSEDVRVAVATILTKDGPVHIGLNRREATKLAHTLQLFLQDWPPDGSTAKN